MVISDDIIITCQSLRCSYYQMSLSCLTFHYATQILLIISPLRNMDSITCGNHSGVSHYWHLVSMMFLVFVTLGLSQNGLPKFFLFFLKFFGETQVLFVGSLIDISFWTSGDVCPRSPKVKNDISRNQIYTRNLINSLTINCIFIHFSKRQQNSFSFINCPC